MTTPRAEFESTEKITVTNWRIFIQDCCELRYVFQKDKYRTLAISIIQRIINEILTLLAQGIMFDVLGGSAHSFRS